MNFNETVIKQFLIKLNNFELINEKEDIICQIKRKDH